MTLQLPEDWHTFDDQAKAELIEKLQRLRAAKIRADWKPYPWQRPHEHPDGDRVCDERCHDLPLRALAPQELWLLIGGRGTGKTDGAAQYVADHVRGPACDPRLPGGHRIAIIGPTLGDTVESCVNGPSGLATHYPGCKVWSSAGGTFVRFPNGSLAKVFGASTPEDVERLRAGGNRCLAWWEELAAWRRLEECMEHSRLGLRIGPRAAVVASTTPKVRKPILKLVDDDPDVVLTRGRTRDAVHLEAKTRAAYEEKYAGTRTGRQELDGEILRDVEGALWTYKLLDSARARGFDPLLLAQALARVVVAIDPAVTNTEESDETGIVVAGRSRRDECPLCGPTTRPHGFVLADYSGRFSARGWAEKALQAFEHFEADVVVAEVNNGGDLVREVISSAVERGKGRAVPYRDVRASRGKKTRAEPVAALYGNVDTDLGPIRPSIVHHVGAFVELEDQQTTWTPDDKDSPDRMDAAVWALTFLLVKSSGGTATVAG